MALVEFLFVRNGTITVCFVSGLMQTATMTSREERKEAKS